MPAPASAGPSCGPGGHGAESRSGTSRQAGTPISSWRMAVSAALRLKVSATAGSSAGPLVLAKRLHQESFQARVNGDHTQFTGWAV